MDAGRDLSSKACYSACYAPTVSMYFDQFGKVRACCQNTDGLLGDVREQTIREIWESAQANSLRGALEQRDFSIGCGFCKWQVDEGGTSPFARGFDRHPVAERRPRWPRQMEFSMTNACNLQCVMCNGDWSSSIRTHREHRPPLPEVYGDEFFDQLAEFLPHLTDTFFLGGEPFLGREPLRVMEMLAELDDPPSVTVTTNGTQWSPRIEAICERLPVSFVLSLDGITKSTYESVRIGAGFDVVMGNLDRFITYARMHGTGVSITHCLMRPNWHEFADLLQFAEDKGLDTVGINTVLFPPELSLFQMDHDELSQVVEHLDRAGQVAAGRLTKLRPVWDEQLAALHNRLRVLETSARGIDPWSTMRRWGSLDAPGSWDDRAMIALTDWALGGAPARLDPTPTGGRWSDDIPDALVGLDLGGLRTGDALVQAIQQHVDAVEVDHFDRDGLRHDVVLRGGPGLEPLEVRVVWTAAGERFRAVVAQRYRVRAGNPSDEPPPDDPVTMLSDWSGGSPIIRLRHDQQNRVVGIDGDLSSLRLRPEDLQAGLDGRRLPGLLQQAWGEVELRASPTGFGGDVLLALGPEAEGERIEVRVLIPPAQGADPALTSDVLVAVRPALECRAGDDA